tara:strand:+ start:992 stop:1582 length:591 start_codon:yes stop_codon:yes gene_type:complete
MITILNMLNVRAEERRAVICFLMCTLVVGNLVWYSMGPRLLTLRSDEKKHEVELADEKMVQADYKEFKQNVEKLNPKDGLSTSEQDAKTGLRRVLSSAAMDSGITLENTSISGSGKTNKTNPFEEFKRNVTFETDLINLVKFLREIALKEDSMIRVSSYTINPTRDKQRLQVKMMFIASYPKPNFGEEKSKKKPNR